MALIRLAVLKRRRARRYLRVPLPDEGARHARDAVHGARHGAGRLSPPNAGQASRFLAQATFGATPADIAAVMRDGYAAWLDAQLAMPPSQTHFGWLLQQGRNTEEYKGNGINAPLDATLWRSSSAPRPGAHPRRLRAVRDLRGERGVHHRVLAAVRRGRLHGPAGRTCAGQLPEPARRRQPEPVHGLHADLSRQPQGRSAHRPPSRRELRARGHAAVQHRPAATASRRHAPPGRRRAGGNLYERRRPGPGGSSPAGTWMAQKPTWNSTAGR